MEGPGGTPGAGTVLCREQNTLAWPSFLKSPLFIVTSFSYSYMKGGGGVQVIFPFQALNAAAKHRIRSGKELSWD